MGDIKNPALLTLAKRAKKCGYVLQDESTGAEISCVFIDRETGEIFPSISSYALDDAEQFLDRFSSSKHRG